MEILEYNDLNISGLESKYLKVREALRRKDFFTAQAKKLKGTEYYSARLDYANRLLFKIIKHNKNIYLLILEIIRNHDYANSRVLNGANFTEDEIIFDENKIVEDEIKYINKNQKQFYFLNKAISFDDQQSLIYEEKLPFIIIGSAGSGKTMLALEKIKTLQGRILYVSLSSYLVNSSRNIYYSNNYQNEAQEVDFLSFNECIESIKVPNKRVVDFYVFKAWFERYKNNIKIKEIDKVYEEFRGTLTGTETSKAFLSKDDYFSLGIKQSLFLKDEKEAIYDLFNKYLEYIKYKELYDPNIIAYDYLGMVTPQYEYVIIDEVQDLTNIQIKFLLSFINTSGHFILCGDSNQIVHPNFFSWAKVKTLLHKENKINKDNMLFLLTTNYRNSKNVTDIANNILKIKQLQFGSIDKESNYLVQSLASAKGNILFMNKKDKGINQLNQISRRSTKYAIIVLLEELKKEAKDYFQNPLVFSIHEAKGLEYENIILFNIVSSAAEKFSDISAGLIPEDLKTDLRYSRSKDKSDKALEIYKFYINAFYVAITRAVENLYIIEEKPNHLFLELLNLTQYANKSEEIAQENASSMEEWQREASKLEKQGKLEQAKNIRDEILKEKKIPWEILTNAEFVKLYHTVMDTEASKGEKLRLFEYSLIYHRHDIIDQLKQMNLKAASHLKNSYIIIKEKYYEEYTRKNITNVMNLTMEYGLDFRNQFNQTPLIIASIVGNSSLVEYLITQGADTKTIDNNGLTALQNFLSSLFSYGKAIDENSAVKMYQNLTVNSSLIKINDQLVKLDPHTMEFFLYNVLLGIFVNYYLYSSGFFKGFTAVNLAKSIEAMPEGIIRRERKKRSYISHMFSKNERNRNGDYNRKLFLRVGYGLYVLNPNIEIKINETWENLYNLINFDLTQEYRYISVKSRLKCMIENIKNPVETQELKQKTKMI